MLKNIINEGRESQKEIELVKKRKTEKWMS